MKSEIIDNPVKKRIEYKKLTFPCILVSKNHVVLANSTSCGMVLDSDQKNEIGHYSANWSFVGVETAYWKLLPENKQIQLSN